MGGLAANADVHKEVSKTRRRVSRVNKIRNPKTKENTRAEADLELRVSSDDFDRHLANFILNAAVAGMLAKTSQVRIFGEPFEIAVAQSERPLQSGRGKVEFAIERVASRQIVKPERVAGFKSGQLLIHTQAVIVTATLRVMVSQYLQRFHIFWIAPHDSFHEGDFDLQF